MKLHLPITVLEAALQRIGRIFDEFEHVAVNFSGGKDSTVVLNLALQVAEERGRLPLPVIFLDQEAEWDCVISYIRRTLDDPRIRPYWFQGHFRLFNATSEGDPWLHCWRPGDAWIRDKEPGSIHDNITGVDRFARLLDAIGDTYWPDTPLAQLNGIRAEESPTRRMGLTTFATYKDITWGNIHNRRRGHYGFSPLYDWAYGDVWKAIHDHHWPYTRLYDLMYQYGVPTRYMRVSSLTHETGMDVIRFLQEVEPAMWDRVCDRLRGINAAGHVQEAYECPDTLPPMFASWEEYRDHLLENLIQDPEAKGRLRQQFDRLFREFDPCVHTSMVRAEIGAILVNDSEFTKLDNWRIAHLLYERNKRPGATPRKGLR